MADHQALLQETLDGTAARAHAAESELAARAMAIPKSTMTRWRNWRRSNKTLFQVVEDRAKQIAELREKLVNRRGAGRVLQAVCGET